MVQGRFGNSGHVLSQPSSRHLNCPAITASSDHNQQGDMMSQSIEDFPTPEEIDEYFTAIYVEDQLDCLECLVREHGSDEDMLEVISILRVDNAFLKPNLDELHRAGRL